MFDAQMYLSTTQPAQFVYFEVENLSLFKFILPVMKNK